MTTTTTKKTKTSTKKKPQAVAPKRAARRRKPAPAHEEIAARAYQLFEQSGYVHGREVDHWLQAEAELTSPARKR